MVVAGIVLGEVLTVVLPLVVPPSGALEAITHRFSVGFDRITLNLYFLILSVSLHLRLSILGAVFGAMFLLIGRAV